MGILNYLRKLEDKQSKEYLNYKAESIKAYQNWLDVGKPTYTYMGKELFLLMKEALNNMIYQTSDGKWKIKTS